MRPAERGGTSDPASVSLLTNGVTWYLRSTIRVAEGRLVVVTPRTFLGFLPIGVRRLESPIRHLNRIRLGTKLFPERLAVAVGLGLVALFAQFATVGVVVLVLATVAMLLLSFVAAIRIEQDDRPPFIVPVCLAHLGRARHMVEEVQKQRAHSGESGVAS